MVPVTVMLIFFGTATLGRRRGRNGPGPGSSGERWLSERLTVFRAALVLDVAHCQSQDAVQILHGLHIFTAGISKNTASSFLHSDTQEIVEVSDNPQFAVVMGVNHKFQHAPIEASHFHFSLDHLLLCQW